MPTFCRHSRLIQNCPICSREQAIELRPVVSSSAPRVSVTRTPSRAAAERPVAGSNRRAGPGVRVRRLARGSDDGYHCPLVPGLKSTEEADRLARELGFAAARLEVLATDPPGLYAEVADPAGDVEERTWLAFLIAYVCPLEQEDPFAAISQFRTPWRSAEQPALDRIAFGPRSAHDPRRGTRTLDAYRVWAARAGSQQAAFSGEPSWTAERRFTRVLERLALPGLSRDARYELLVLLGRTGLHELYAGTLALGGENEVTVAAKRALGIGDPLLLERRALALAQAVQIPLDALDLGLYNWERGSRVRLGLSPELEPTAGQLAKVQLALGLR